MVFGSGTTPRKSDTRRMLLWKYLVKLQANAASPFAANNPANNDTIRRLRVKIVRSRKGIGNNGA